ncbi:MAG: efflux RND transporter periplasmic adaptor subunit [Alphaproteobacteria bacterium]|jgi:cobalt-zinc-cadmium efflux system membrane fusion protein|nr:efflux RND transporter periplasmic adaptor subunit [Alphaproteobacteria bacterium]
MNKKGFIKVVLISIAIVLGFYYIPFDWNIAYKFFGQEENQGTDDPTKLTTEKPHDSHHEEKKHDEHEAHGGFKEHGNHEHEEEKIIKLSPEQVKRFGIETLKINKSSFQHRLTLPGHVELNENTITHVVPSVPGVAKEIYKGLGEVTKVGEPLATLQSRDMAEAKSAYISAHKDFALKQDLYEREEYLWKKGVKSETQFIQTRNTSENAKVNLEQKKQKLLALGMNEEKIQQLPEEKAPLNIYTIDSPIAGKVIERHITLGEVISGDKQVFVIANLDTVWVELAIPAEDLQFVKKDQKVDLFAHQGESIQSGTIMYVSPVINDESRTGKAIIQLENSKQEWHPGDFITAQVIVSEQSSYLSLPKSVIQKINEKPHVFVKRGEGIFEAKPIQIKGSDKGEFIEVMSGVQVGEELVSTNTFILKAELGKGEAEHTD